MLLALTTALPLVEAQPAARPAPRKALVADEIKGATTPPPAALGLDPFYKKYADADGLPIVSSEKVPDVALLMARDIVNFMLQARPDVRATLVARKSRVSVMAESEAQTDLPECRDWKKPAPNDPRLTPGERARYNQPGGIASMTDRQYWNQRARGMGGNFVSCAEENLMGYAGTRYYGEHILVHEFSHNIMSALRDCDRPLWDEIHAAYKGAMAAGLYEGEYATNTVAEYWAEGTQWWFWSNYEFYDRKTGARVQSPDDFRAYDPRLHAIMEKVYAGHHIPADIYHAKNLRPAKPPAETKKSN